MQATSRLQARRLASGARRAQRQWRGPSSAPCRALWRRKPNNDDDDWVLQNQDEYFHEVITLLTADGNIVRIPGSSTPQLRMPSWEEQKLCIGASFVLAATNGHDPTRRINMEGFCQSVDYLFDSIEDAVYRTRGEILIEERELKSGLHEVLKVTVAVPFLWGVPPQVERLSSAINSGGGVVHRMYHEWVISSH